ncbi:MAG: DUF2807 domain-containing protein [Cytophagaceae bacterium]|nr:DUF2807 domain-containing protein [Cytophagaceae bacterium]
MIFLLWLVSCEGILRLDVWGDGNIITDTARWENSYNISNIELTDEFRLEIYRSQTPALHVEADSNLMSYIKTGFERNRLTIQRQADHNLKPRKQIVVRLYIDGLTSITVRNGGDVLCDTITAEYFTINTSERATFKASNLNIKNLSLNAESGSIVNAKGELEKISVTQRGSGETYLQGSADVLSLLQYGSGKIEALEMISNHIDISLNGSGLIYCSANESLHINIKGTGWVCYRADFVPQIFVEGEGNVVKY